MVDYLLNVVTSTSFKKMKKVLKLFCDATQGEEMQALRVFGRQCETYGSRCGPIH